MSIGMSMALPEPPLLVISDRTLARLPLPELAAAAFESGLRWFMLREKDLGDDALEALASEIAARAQPFGARLTINGNAAVAARRGISGVHGGVHLPQGQCVSEARRIAGNAALIGVSAHDEAEARRAADEGADYVTLSPVFTPTSKPDYGPALGLDELGRIAGAVDIPVVALGGIDPANAGDCLAAGAAGVAVLGGVMAAANPREAVAALLAAIRCARTARSPASSRS